MNRYISLNINLLIIYIIYESNSHSLHLNKQINLRFLLNVVFILATFCCWEAKLDIFWLKEFVKKVFRINIRNVVAWFFIVVTKFYNFKDRLRTNKKCPWGYYEDLLDALKRLFIIPFYSVINYLTHDFVSQLDNYTLTLEGWT